MEITTQFLLFRVVPLTQKEEDVCYKNKEHSKGMLNDRNLIVKLQKSS